MFSRNKLRGPSGLVSQQSGEPTWCVVISGRAAHSPVA